MTGKPHPCPRAAFWWFAFVGLGWTWGLGFAAAWLDAPAGHPLHLLALLGPLAAWCGVLLAMTAPSYRRAFLLRVFDPRPIRGSTVLRILLVGAGPAVAAVLIAGLAGSQLGVTPAGVVALAGIVGFALAAGFAEEPGWRGLAHDGRMADTLGRCLAVGVLWSAWHLPLYFIDGTYQHGLGVGTTEFWTSMLVRVPLAVLLAWTVTRANGAVLPAVLAHALGNVVGEVLGVAGVAMTWELAVMTVAAVLVLRASSRSSDRGGPLERAGSAVHQT